MAGLIIFAIICLFIWAIYQENNKYGNRTYDNVYPKEKRLETEDKAVKEGFSEDLKENVRKVVTEAESEAKVIDLRKRTKKPNKGTSEEDIV